MPFFDPSFPLARKPLEHFSKMPGPPNSVFLHHFGTNTTGYLQSQFVT